MVDQVGSAAISLDVYLKLPGEAVPGPQIERIFLRKEGTTVELTRAEWDELYPGREPATMICEADEREVFEANITHNMGPMAKECAIYDELWRPEEIGITKASQLIGPLALGLSILYTDRERLQEFNPENGWGSYELLVKFVENYLRACVQWPEAEVSVWR